jgi:hypothetical protein
MLGNEALACATRQRGGTGARKIFALGGHDNPLKRLNPDKEAQGNPSLFL